MKPTWKWDIDLAGMIDGFAAFETKDGVIREGRISQIRYEPVLINTVEHLIPYGFELNGDPLDLVEIQMIKSIQIS